MQREPTMRSLFKTRVLEGEPAVGLSVCIFE